MAQELAQAPSLELSRAMHEAVARYDVVVSRQLPRAEDVVIARGLTWSEARTLRDTETRRLAQEEPDLQGCMSRSLACIRMTNAKEVATILGYGPDFSEARALERLREMGVELAPRRAEGASQA